MEPLTSCLPSIGVFGVCSSGRRRACWRSKSGAVIVSGDEVPPLPRRVPRRLCHGPYRNRCRGSMARILKGGGMRWLLRTTTVLLPTFVVGMARGILILPLGLGFYEEIVWLLALGVSAFVSSLTATWLSNRTAPDGTRRRLAPVLGVAEATALVLTLVVSGIVATPLLLVVSANVLLLAIATALVALAATLATTRSRSRDV